YFRNIVLPSHRRVHLLNITLPRPVPSPFGARSCATYPELLPQYVWICGYKDSVLFSKLQRK
ncbi:MAG: hypothetical protein PHQ77_03450, partial [Proteiniphilum sp.]|nr:hypothetical protein [Proteiniphilum sp.]